MNDTGRNKAPASDSRSRRASDAESGHVAELYRALNEQINEARVALEPWATSHDLTTRILAIPLENGGYRVVLMFESDDTLLLIEVADGVVDGGVQPVFLVWTSLAASKPLAVHKYGWAAVITAFTWLFGHKVRAELESKNLQASQESGAVLTVNLADRLELSLASTDSGCGFRETRRTCMPHKPQAMPEACVQAIRPAMRENTLARSASGITIHLHLPGGGFGMARVQASSSGCRLWLHDGHTENVSGDINTAVLPALVRVFSLSLLDVLRARGGALSPPDHLNS